jgi:hypothetical protein
MVPLRVLKERRRLAVTRPLAHALWSNQPEWRVTKHISQEHAIM